MLLENSQNLISLTPCGRARNRMSRVFSWHKMDFIAVEKIAIIAAEYVVSLYEVEGIDEVQHEFDTNLTIIYFLSHVYFLTL